jgi:nucleoid-associated protein YgaU
MASLPVIRTGETVIIRRGDNLWRISRRMLGQGIRYTVIYEANRDQIRDPALIYPGQVFDVPESERG